MYGTKRRKTMKQFSELWRSHFVKGLAAGLILVAVLFVSWKAVLVIAGIAALYCLFCKSR